MSDQKPVQKVTYLGQVDYRNKQLTFGIKEKDRTRHMYVIGKTGMGKSTLLENMAIQDIVNGEGVCVIDPHGSMAEKLLDYIPKERVDDVIYFAPFDTEYPLGLNVLEKVEFSKRHLVANGLMSAFKKIFGEDRFSDRIQYILNNIILSLLECDGESLLGVNRMLNDKEYRKYVISNIKDPSVRSFWLEEYAKAGEKYQQEAAPGIQNKIGQFISNPLIRNIIGQKNTAFDVREVMDNKKILIVNLSKGKVGEGNANLIGSLLITKIYLAAMSRADAGVHSLESLPPFYFYVDEFQNFANDSFANILSEARKYNLALTVAHQYIEQMTDEVKAAVFGNVGTMITFRVGATDAEVFEKEFAPYFMMDDIVNLSAFQVYLRLMIDGVGSKPFSAQMLPPIKKPDVSYAQEIIELSREKYAKKLSLAEEEVRLWYEPKIITTEKTDIKLDSQKEVKVPEKNKEREYDAPKREEKRSFAGNSNGNNGGRYDQKKGGSSDTRREERRDERRVTDREAPKQENSQSFVVPAVATATAVGVVESLSQERAHQSDDQDKIKGSESSSNTVTASPSLAERIKKAQEEAEKERISLQSQKEESRQPSLSPAVSSLQPSASQETRRDTAPTKSEVLFDDEKPVSLKDALLRAIKEKESLVETDAQETMHAHRAQSLLRPLGHEERVEERVSSSAKKETNSAYEQKEDLSSSQNSQAVKTAKEVSADVLNPLIKDRDLDTLLANEE